MSCITEILKLKGDSEILITPLVRGLAIEGGGIYKDYEYLITFTDLGSRCGYIALPPDHEFNKFEDYYDFEQIDCHGGITFAGTHHPAKDLLKDRYCLDKWIGFDCGHSIDGCDFKTVKKYFFSCDDNEIFKSMQELQNLIGEKPKSFSYVEDECKKIIDQLRGERS